MSNADEILKLKELLDKEIITNEEFEKKKRELLESKTVMNNIPNTSLNRKNSCLTTIISILIILIVSFVIVGQLVIEPSNQKYYNNQEVVQNLISSYSDFSNILQQCGFSNYTLERDELLDDLDGDGTIGIRIRMSNINGIIYIKDGAIHSVRYADNYLYKDGIIQHTLY